MMLKTCIPAGKCFFIISVIGGVNLASVGFNLLGAFHDRAISFSAS